MIVDRREQAAVETLQCFVTLRAGVKYVSTFNSLISLRGSFGVYCSVCEIFLPEKTLTHTCIGYGNFRENPTRRAGATARQE